MTAEAAPSMKATARTSAPETSVIAPCPSDTRPLAYEQQPEIRGYQEAIIRISTYDKIAATDSVAGCAVPYNGERSDSG